MTPSRQPHGHPAPNPDQLTVLLTGASSGLGRAVATQLAAAGHRVLAVGRDPRKVATLREDLQRASPGSAPSALATDIAVRSGWEAVAVWARETTTFLDAVVHNAGVMLPRRTVTADGYEQQFAVHHLAPFAITARLWPLLTRGGVPERHQDGVAAGRARVVNVNSAGHQVTLGGHVEPVLDFADLQAEHDYDPFLVYGRTKLANMLFTYELARRHGDVVIASALHPGVVKSDLGRAFPRWRARLAQASGTSPERAAPAVTRLVTDPGRTSTAAYYDRDRETRSSGPSYDRAAAGRLWTITEQLAGPFPA